MHSFKTAVDAPRSLRPSEIQYSIRSVDHDSVRSVMVVGVELVVCLVHQPTSEESRLLTYIYIYIYMVHVDPIAGAASLPAIATSEDRCVGLVANCSLTSY